MVMALTLIVTYIEKKKDFFLYGYLRATGSLFSLSLLYMRIASKDESIRREDLSFPP